MKQYIYLTEWIEFVRIHPKAAEFIFMWAQQEGYVRGSDKYLPNFGEIVHFLMVNSSSYHTEDYLHMWPNHALKFEEFQLGFDGDEPIEIAWYYMQEVAKEIVSRY